MVKKRVRKAVKKSLRKNLKSILGERTKIGLRGEKYREMA